MSNSNTSTNYTTYFNEIHDQVRQSFRKFVAEHITPNINEWEESGSFPRELYH
ncbi:acyl-CoA dehydrogenase family protein, partial [Rhizobium hidalgonense]|uniref:acyl-CoA dehydrogenase family protein n=1 Tax=Rhizobium hidalgonense TaxID=1538159 RepID=UPI0035C747A7